MVEHLFDIIMKHCFKCGELKPLSEFYKHREMADGHLNKCKDCTKADVSGNYRARKPYYQDYYRQREGTEKRKEQRRRYKQIFKTRSPEKYHAQNLVQSAVRCGKLERQPCEICGHTKTEAHHDDYGKPLVVRWLCFAHHRQAHGQLAA